MKVLTILQHTSAEYLGYLEDHLEGRNIGFRYVRPFAEGIVVPRPSELRDGLILLGGGPWGSAGARNLPTLSEEIALARYCLHKGLPLIGFGLGAQIVSLAGDGGVSDAPLRFEIGEARRVDEAALGGYLPPRLPQVVYMRDRAAPPDYARILARDENDQPAVFQLGERAFAFAAHPGFKAAMAEDLIMEFEESPADPGPTLERLRSLRGAIEDSLARIAAGLVAALDLMA